MESILRDEFNHIFVSGNTGSFQGFRGDLFLFIRNDVNDVGEFFNVGFLSTGIVDSDSGIGDTSVVSGLGIRLTLGLSVASSRSSTHLYDICFWSILKFFFFRSFSKFK